MSMANALNASVDAPTAGAVAYFGEDWQTQGQWVGRYGRQWAKLCAAEAPFDSDEGWDRRYKIDVRLGDHAVAGDGVRHWIQWLRTDNPRSLYMPLLGYARQAEDDDHGEELGMAVGGIGLVYTVTIPAGVHAISAYFFNKDEHDWSGNRYREYLLTLTGPGSDGAGPQTACTVVRDFWGGVYETFLANGPGNFTLTVDRNNSFNTICSGVFVDRLSGESSPADKYPLPFMGSLRCEPPVVDTAARSKRSPLAGAAADLWQAAETAERSFSNLDAVNRCRVAAYRAASASGADETALGAIRYGMHDWTAEDKSAFATQMAAGWRSYSATKSQSAQVTKQQIGELKK
jgi:hypothetical protein